MGFGPFTSSKSDHFFSCIKSSVMISCLVAVAAREVSPAGFTRRSCHHSPTPIVTALQRRPQARRMSFRERQRLRRTLLPHESFSTRTPLRTHALFCSCTAFFSSIAPRASTDWRSSNDGMPLGNLRETRGVPSRLFLTGPPTAVYYTGGGFRDGGRGSRNLRRSGCSKNDHCEHVSTQDDAGDRAAVKIDGSWSSKAVKDIALHSHAPEDGIDDINGSSIPVPSGMEPLVERVASTLEHHCHVRGGDLVLVLVSGGSDSVALLLALEKAARIFQPALRVEATHFNHALRGEDSDADQEFVEGLARNLGIPLHVRRWRGADEGGTGGPGAGMQERARRWRRSEAQDILSTRISESGAGHQGRQEGFIATAHHRDDQAETVLLKALRGAHITKMQGMACHAAPFVRPLLWARKSDLTDFLQEQGQDWREDGSNQVPKYARNRVRLQLVPLLQELAGGARALDTRLGELSRQSLFAREMLEREALRWEREHLHGHLHDTGSGGDAGKGGHDGTIHSFERSFRSKEIDEGLEVSPPGIRRNEFPLPAFLKSDTRSRGKGEEQRHTESDLPELVREELLHRFVMANTGMAALPYAQLQLLMRQVDGGERMWSLSLGGDYCLRRVGDLLRIEQSGANGGVKRLGLEGPRSSVGTADARRRAGQPSAEDSAITPWRLEISPLRNSSDPVGEDVEESKSEQTERGMVLYNVAAGTKLGVRRKRNGDRFRPAWRDRPAKLKDFLRGQGVPLHRRDEVALICVDDNVIAVYPSYPGFEFSQDNTGVPPILVRIKGAPLFSPHPEDRGGTPP